jgi:hypothetical protein
MQNLRRAIPVFVSWALLWSPPAVADSTNVAVKQSRLTPVCVDGSAKDAQHRKWQLKPGDHVIAFTMQNAPRSAADAPADPGIAVIRFTVETDHRYEVEIRAASETYSARNWSRGAWRPVVRDRTTDRIVSGEPEWVDQACTNQ